MNSLLIDRKTGRIKSREFNEIITESLYYNLRCLNRPKFKQQLTKGAINAIDFEHQEYRYLLSGCADSTVKLWDTCLVSSGDDEEDGYCQEIAKIDKNDENGHKYGITGVKWWPFDNGMFLTSSYDGQLKIWDADNVEEACKFNMNSKINCFDVSNSIDNSLICCGSDSSFIRILDLRTIESTHTLVGHNGSVLSCKWSRNDSNLLASGSSNGELLVWDIRKTKSCIMQMDFNRTESEMPPPPRFKKYCKVKAHNIGGVNGINWTEIGNKLISCGNDNKIRCWDLNDGHGVNLMINFGDQLMKNRSERNKSFVLSPVTETEIQYLWFPSDNGEIIISRLIDGKNIARLRKPIKENSKNTCIVYKGNNSGVCFTGTVDGNIAVWGNKYENNESDDDELC